MDNLKARLISTNMSDSTEMSSTKDANAAAARGSASWLGADEYDVGDELHKRTTAFFKAVNWGVLASRSSDLRSGIPCDFGKKYSIGHFNMVRHILFADGVSWVARLRLPPLKEKFGNREALSDTRVLRVEDAYMKFLKYVNPPL